MEVSGKERQMGQSYTEFIQAWGLKVLGWGVGRRMEAGDLMQEKSVCQHTR
jgi:hypothetical protein